MSAAFGEFGSLTSLFAYGNNLVGSIPDTLSMLTQLQQLYLYSNSLTGSIPNGFSMLTQLQLLYLYSNRLTGSIPDGFSSLSNLILLDVDINQLSGTVPSLSGMLNLQLLFLGNNNFSGPLSSSMTALSSLQFFYMNNNPIGGTLPTWLFQLPALQQLSMANTSLVGTLPVEIAEARNLTLLDLGHNLLNGTLPEALISPPLLQVVLLNNNQFSGTIPLSLLQSPFDTLNLRNNLLTGSLPYPIVISEQYAVSQLLLDNNHLVGYLPSTNPPLSILSVSNNSFNGPIAFDSDCIMSLVNLDNNQFSGPVPDLSQCSTLQALSIQHNDGVVTFCTPQQARSNATQCLPPFLRIDRNNIQQFDDNTQCATFAGNSDFASLQVNLDVQSYLYGAQCTCQQKFFWPPQADNVTGLTCVACPSSTNLQVPWCQCELGAMTNCYAVQNTTGGWTALECPYIASPAITACAFRQPSSDASSTCTDSLQCQCAEGYTNRRCSQCQTGYFASGRACSLCSPVLVWLLPVVYIVVIVIFLLYLLKIQGSSTGVLKIAAFYGQSLLVVVSNASVPWPQFIASFLQASSQTGSLSLTALECVLVSSSLAQRYAIYVATPAVLVIICFVIFLLRRWAGGDKQAVADHWRVLVFMVLSVLLTTYFDVSVKALSALSCILYDVADPAHMYLNAYPWIACDAHSPQYAGILAAGVIALLVYTIGVPTVVFGLLVHARYTGDLQSDDNMRRLGFVYGCYRPAAFFWEAVLILRRLLLTFALTLVPFTSSELSVVIIGVVLLLSIAAQHTVQPFASVLENRLEQLVLYVLTITFLGVYVAEASTSSPSPLLWLPTVLVIVNVITAIVLGLCVLLVLAASVANRPAVARLLSRIGFPVRHLSNAQRVLSAPLLDKDDL
eukprot:TRINITY_DN1473_c0_g1_i4.p1 TRINITY_DN1473_c0_g1~~TRINITY_DN1473_c0_g1_i4.p1  ORF type:complete len:899 (-),score=212.63 TRINITY_DN1473_c0_g1_i4:234-2930(-)